MVRIWLGAMAGAMVIAAATALGSPSGPSAATVRSEQARGAEAIMDLLEQKERGLARRESTLAAREADLRAAEEQVKSRLEQIESLRATITEQLADLDDRQESRVKSLVKMMESIRDKQAAAILAQTDEVIALEVLMRMNTAKAGKALAAMPAATAADFAARMGAPPLSQETP